MHFVVVGNVTINSFRKCHFKCPCSTRVRFTFSLHCYYARLSFAVFSSSFFSVLVRRHDANKKLWEIAIQFYVGNPFLLLLFGDSGDWCQFTVYTVRCEYAIFFLVRLSAMFFFRVRQRKVSPRICKQRHNKDIYQLPWNNTKEMNMEIHDEQTESCCSHFETVSRNRDKKHIIHSVFFCRFESKFNWNGEC